MKKKLAFALVALVTAMSSQAETVSFQAGLPLALTTTELTNVTNSLGLFNSNLGTLTGATLNLFGGASFEYSGSNSSGQIQYADITSSTTLFWSSSVAALFPFLAANSMAMSSSSGTLNYEKGQVRSFGPFTANKTAQGDLVNILTSLSVAGGGNLDLTCNSLSGLTVLGGGGNLGSTQSTQAGCGANITYVYDAAPLNNVPEPGSLALVGLAIAGLSLVRKGRKA